MTNASPEDERWLCWLVQHSPLLPDPSLRRHWQKVIPWLRPADRYALAAILLDIDHACGT